MKATLGELYSESNTKKAAVEILDTQKERIEGGTRNGNAVVDRSPYHIICIKGESC